MEWITTEILDAPSPQVRAAWRGSRPLLWGDTKLPPCDEAPDPRYWTAYDIHMIERDARAMRRAHVYSMLAALWGRVRRRIFAVGGTAQAERSVA
jgi:hypothetical protein